MAVFAKPHRLCIAAAERGFWGAVSGFVNIGLEGYLTDWKATLTTTQLNQVAALRSCVSMQQLHSTLSESASCHKGQLQLNREDNAAVPAAGASECFHTEQ